MKNKIKETMREWNEIKNKEINDLLNEILFVYEFGLKNCSKKLKVKKYDDEKIIKYVFSDLDDIKDLYIVEDITSNYIITYDELNDEFIKLCEDDFKLSLVLAKKIIEKYIEIIDDDFSKNDYYVILKLCNSLEEEIKTYKSNFVIEKIIKLIKNIINI